MCYNSKLIVFSSLTGSSSSHSVYSFFFILLLKMSAYKHRLISKDKWLQQFENWYLLKKKKIYLWALLNSYKHFATFITYFLMFLKMFTPIKRSSAAYGTWQKPIHSQISSTIWQSSWDRLTIAFFIYVQCNDKIYDINVINCKWMSLV